MNIFRDEIDVWLFSRFVVLVTGKGIVGMIGGRVRMLQGWEEERAMMGGGDEDEDEDEDEEEGVEVRPSDGWSEATAKALYRLPGGA